MGRLLEPFDAQLTRGAHARHDLLAAGITAHELKGPLWQRLDQGRYAWAAKLPPTCSDRIRLAVPLLPSGAVIGGWAAAVVHGAVGLDGESAEGTPWPVQLCMSRHQTCRRSEGVSVFRSDLDPVDRIVIDGIPVTSLSRTAFDLARLDPRTSRPDGDRPAIVESVVWLDAMLRDAALDPGALAGYLQDRRRRRGVTRAREAIELADERSASAQETRLRMLWMLDAKLPRPLTNASIFDQQGNLLGIADLFDPGAALCVEYDGSFHASAARRSRDLVRAEGLERAGITVVRLTSDDLGDHRFRTIHRLRARYQEGLGRDRSRDRWTAELHPIT